jgi:hypothetical protein
MIDTGLDAGERARREQARLAAAELIGAGPVTRRFRAAAPLSAMSPMSASGCCCCQPVILFPVSELFPPSGIADDPTTLTQPGTVTAP